MNKIIPLILPLICGCSLLKKEPEFNRVVEKMSENNNEIVWKMHDECGKERYVVYHKGKSE